MLQVRRGQHGRCDLESMRRSARSSCRPMRFRPWTHALDTPPVPGTTKGHLRLWSIDRGSKEASDQAQKVQVQVQVQRSAADGREMPLDQEQNFPH